MRTLYRFIPSDTTCLSIGDRFPRRRRPVLRMVGAFVLRQSGWQVVGTLPDVRKCVLIAAPHTSNWDFVFGIAAVLAFDLEIHWLGKDALFCNPFGRLLRALGGIPVHRAAPQSFVEQAINVFYRRDHFVLGITPEGTRRPVARWKTGFYRIARGAGVPIVPVFIDYGHHTIGVGLAFVPSADMEADFKALQNLYQHARGKHPRVVRAV